VVAERDKEDLAQRQARCAAALLHLGAAAPVWPLLRRREDARLRTHLIHLLRPLGVELDVLVKRLEEERDTSARRALLLGVGELDGGKLPAARREELAKRWLALYRADPDPGVHSALGWLLERWGRGADVRRADRELRSKGPARGRGWYVNGQAQTLAVVRGPVEFRMSRTGYRLPTEAEWEYACRAGSTTSRFYGAGLALLDHYGWHTQNAQDRTWPVGRLKPNNLGLFDVYGNALEWCQDATGLYPLARPGRAVEDREQAGRVVEAKWPRVARGAAFDFLGTYLRSARRHWYTPGNHQNSNGLRVARTVR
jgi:hypothetical protein